MHPTRQRIIEAITKAMIVEKIPAHRAKADATLMVDLYDVGFLTIAAILANKLDHRPDFQKPLIKYVMAVTAATREDMIELTDRLSDSTLATLAPDVDAALASVLKKSV